jgi:hypothetical protein
METKTPPDDSEILLLGDEEIERLLALELACECLLAHVEERDSAGKAEPEGLREAEPEGLRAA